LASTAAWLPLHFETNVILPGNDGEESRSSAAYTEPSCSKQDGLRSASAAPAAKLNDTQYAENRFDVVNGVIDNLPLGMVYATDL
jgi:hypothetical protein